MTKTIIALALFGFPALADAQTIQGRWKLLAAEDLRADGSVARLPWGKHPVGTIVVQGGLLLWQIMSSDVPTFTAATPSVSEQMSAALLSTYIAYSGPVHNRRGRRQGDAEGRGGVAPELRRHRAGSILPLRERQDVIRPGAGLDARGHGHADSPVDARTRSPEQKIKKTNSQEARRSGEAPSSDRPAGS